MGKRPQVRTSEVIISEAAAVGSCSSTLMENTPHSGTPPRNKEAVMLDYEPRMRVVQKSPTAVLLGKATKKDPMSLERLQTEDGNPRGLQGPRGHWQDISCAYHGRKGSTTSPSVALLLGFECGMSPTGSLVFGYLDPSWCRGSGRLWNIYD